MDQSKWISSESAEWVQEGIILPEQQVQILNRYQAAKSGNAFLILFSIIGSLLIGAGIILIFATNWWRMPVVAKLLVAFLPLLASQALCLFTAKKKYHSVAFCEGTATFLSLSFFATMALIGQVFHLASDLRSYLLVCGSFALPAAYLFHSKTALSIFVVCALYSAQDWPFALLFFLASLPLFYLEIRRSQHQGILGYLLILLSGLICLVVCTAMREPWLAVVLSIGVALLLLDVVFQRISQVEFFTPAKLVGSIFIALTLYIAGFDFSGSSSYEPVLIVVVFLCGVYAVLRWRTFHGLSPTDSFVISAAILSVNVQIMGIMANLLLFALGVFFIVYGSKSLRLAYLNIGMLFLVLLISIRFFDSSLSLPAKGVAFIFLGIAFLVVNIVITRKRKSFGIQQPIEEDKAFLENEVES